MGRQNRKKIPDRWIDYEPFHRVIDGTNIVAFKVPLPLPIFQDEMLADHRWTPLDVMEKIPNLGLVIDLTFKYPAYYNPMQFLENGVDYLKIGCAGHVVPKDETYLEFYEAIGRFHEEQPDQVVGVHCTHGVNRTGYMICRYLVEKYGYSAEKAFETFEAKRGYPVERANYLDHVRQIANARRF